MISQATLCPICLGDKNLVLIGFLSLLEKELQSVGHMTLFRFDCIITTWKKKNQ